ncbi:hypothetical protein ACF05T_04945 [Streptomyces lateritius]|uniref:Uncharacterized protein n=1 Tax=Streptomyces lateritius TaxID=67313 RepID=A0ABW6Y6N5_9ACTN
MTVAAHATEATCVARAIEPLNRVPHGRVAAIMRAMHVVAPDGGLLAPAQPRLAQRRVTVHVLGHATDPHHPSGERHLHHVA